MARTSIYTCKTCGTKYEFCLKCQVTRPNYDAENFCSHKHADIYATLSKHGCNLISADDALKELSVYNIDNIALAEDVAAHIARIESEATVKVDAPAAVEAKAPQYNKKRKKKW